MKTPVNSKYLKTISCLAVLLAGSLSVLRAQAPALNPDSGYAGFQQQYLIPYSSPPGFGTASPSAPEVAIKLEDPTYNHDSGIILHSYDMTFDTGSRGIYVSANLLPSDYSPTPIAGYPTGQLYLSSSKRLFEGTWTNLTASFPGYQAAGGATGAAQSTLPVLVVQQIGAQGGNATYDTYQESGTVTVTDSSSPAPFSVPIINYQVTLSPGQVAAYADNPGKFKPSSNFGVGIDPSGTSTNPNNTNQYNQQFNAFLNLDQMKAGTMRAGYVLTQSGIQVGLTADTKGFAYTNLIPTGLAQVPGSPPDWQIPTGTLVYGGNTSTTGRVLVDVGIGNAYMILPGQPDSGEVTGNYTVNLLNSEGALSFEVNSDPENFLTPSPDSKTGWRTQWSPFNPGPFSESQSPYGEQFLNTGRNVINGFDLVYDADGGLFGLKLNLNPDIPLDAAIKSAANIQFTAGYYPSPIPEPSAAVLVASSAVILLGWRLNLRLRRTRKRVRPE